MVVSGILFIFAAKSTKPYLPMRLVRMAIIMIMQISAVVAFADETTEISRLDSILRKARQQGDMNKEDEALVLKMTFFYNNEWDDSLKKELRRRWNC